MGNYGASIRQIFSSYQGEPLIQALEILIKTAEEGAVDRAPNATAETVCEGLHEGKGRGLKCLSCYEAEQGLQYVQQAEAEIALAKERRDDDREPSL